MEYMAPTEARELGGLRLALTCHAPAPYSMSARSIFDLKNVPYVPVVQIGAGPNEDLVAWTGHRNAPVAVYNDEAPRVGWLEILNLAERLGSGPPLIPEDVEERMRMIALTNELIGENGFIWNMRLLMLGLGGPERSAEAAKANPMYAQYGYSERAREAATERAKTILKTFTDHARGQRDAGRRYLIGNALSALDIYWVYFSQIVRTLPEADCPMPKGLRKSYDIGSEVIGGCETFLIEQRDWIIAEHLQLPMEF